MWASCLDQCRRNRASPPPKCTTRNDAQDSGRSGRCFSRRCFRDKAPRARGAGSLSLKQCRVKQRPLRPEGRTPGRSWSPSDRERGSPNDGQESMFEGGGSRVVGSRGGGENSPSGAPSTQVDAAGAPRTGAAGPFRRRGQGFAPRPLLSPESRGLDVKSCRRVKDWAPDCEFVSSLFAPPPILDPRPLTLGVGVGVGWEGTGWRVTDRRFRNMRFHRAPFPQAGPTHSRPPLKHSRARGVWRA